VLIGVDLLTMTELDELLGRRWFREYVYTNVELATAATLGHSRQREFLAGRFAAKEAVVKALGRGFGGGVTPRQAEVLRADSGAPLVRLRDALAREATSLGVAELVVSISHKDGLVIAVAIGLGAAGDAARLADTVAEQVVLGI
jgi:phosphopantetheine--protein transferase-like protein